ncbi:caldesmon-like [Neodiprion pinetum]|uniref:caldesmon-like n=1 Tax=Neodiprion pinetum TaxID=441929 RepID=UPI00371CF17C
MPIETRTGSKKESGASADDSLQLKYTETDVEFIKQEVSNKEKRLQKEKEALDERQAEMNRKSRHLSEQFKQQEAELEKKQRAIESSKDPTKGTVDDSKYPTQSKLGKVDEFKYPAQLSASMADDKIGDTNEAPGRSKLDEPRLGPTEDTKLSELLRKKAEIDREVQLLVAQNSRGTDKAVTENAEIATDATFREPGPACTRSKDELRLEAEILHFKKKAERKKGDLRKSLATHKPNLVDSQRTDPLNKGAISRNALNQNLESDHVSIKSVVSVPTDDEELNLEAEALTREALIRRIQRENREKLKILRGGITGPNLGPQELGEPGAPEELVLDKDLEIQLREQEIWERELDLQEQELAYQAAQADPFRERRRKLAEREEQLKKREQALKDKISGTTRP